MSIFAGLLQAAFAVALLVQRDFGVQKAAPALLHYQHEGQEQHCLWKARLNHQDDLPTSLMAKAALSPLTCHWRRDPDNLILLQRQALHQSMKPSAALNPPSWHELIFPPWIMQSRQMPSPLLPVITPPQHPSAAPGAALEATTPAPKALSVSGGLGIFGVPVLGGAETPTPPAQMLSAILIPGEFQTDFPHGIGLFAFLDAVHLQHSHHPQPFHLERQFPMCGRRHRKCTEKLGIPPAGTGNTPHQVRQSSPNRCCPSLPFSLQPHH